MPLANESWRYNATSSLTGWMHTQNDRDHFAYVPSQWESTLQGNFISDWLGAHIEWSLLPFSIIWNQSHQNKLQIIHFYLTHWGRVTRICVSDLTSIGSDNGLSPGRRQAIIRTNAGILLIRPLGTNFSEFVVEILIFSFKKVCLKESSAKRRPFCLGLNELIVSIESADSPAPADRDHFMYVSSQWEMPLLSLTSE